MVLSCLSFFQAQKYQALVDELEHNRLQLSLSELYHNEKAIDVLSHSLEEKQQAAAAKNTETEKWEQEVKSHKKEHGRLTREQQHVEKEIRCVLSSSSSAVLFFSVDEPLIPT